MDLKTLVRDIQDFPTPGILFRDITPLLQSPAGFGEALDGLERFVASLGAEAVVAVEARGFLVGAPLAARLSLPFVPVRKAGALPSSHFSVEYSLEYGRGELQIHTDALAPGQRAVIIDDLLATGGTAEAASRLVEMLGAEVVGYGFLIDLSGHGGRERLAGRQVYSLISY